MKTVIRVWISVYMLSIGTSVIGQDNSNNHENKVQFKPGVFYNSHLHYYGRTDSLQSSGFFPIGELWFSSNVYINAAPVFVSNKANHFQYAGTVATIGYQAKSHDEKFLTHIFLAKPFYRERSQLVQSALKEQLTASFEWQSKVINISFGGDVKRSDKFDYGLSVGLNHLFRKSISENIVLVINPAATLNAGTQQFSKTYFEKRSILLLPAPGEEVNKRVTMLNILSYEFSAPLILVKDKVQLIVIPAFVIPQNLITVENRTDLSEQGKPSFYVTAGMKLSF